ncbi:MAG: nitroreductase family protein [Desulfofustis sp.]|nr:nitroreductase family protein [Desulfofustis sp.]
MKNLIERTRTFRRFEQDRTIDRSVLEELVNLARLGGSARNCQPWQYAIFTDADDCKKIFPYLGWAGYLSDWKGPESGEQPSAYILCILNRDWLKGSDKEAHFDLGIATQNLLLGDKEKGIGGCRIGAFSPKLMEIFKLGDHQELSLVVALGYPAEQVVLEACEEGDIKYWRDGRGVHHVPKRELDEILIEIGFK